MRVDAGGAMDRRAESRAAEGHDFVGSFASVRASRICVISVLLAFSIWLVAAASAAAFDAQGSVEQVYVTGLAANAQASLLNSRGETVSTKNPQGEAVTTQTADSLGGLIFRNVKPASGYRVRLTSTGETSEALTVHTDASEPWDPGVYNQEISDNGYTYLTTRDGIKLAIDVHTPTSPAGEPGIPSEFHFPPSRSKA